MDAPRTLSSRKCVVRKDCGVAQEGRVGLSSLGHPQVAQDRTGLKISRPAVNAIGLGISASCLGHTIWHVGVCAVSGGPEIRSKNSFQRRDQRLPVTMIS